MIENLNSDNLYHRSYRTLPGSWPIFLLQFCLFAVPLAVVTILFYPQITLIICLITQHILGPMFGPGMVNVVEIDYIKLIGNLSFIELPSRYPTQIFSLVNTFICLVPLFLLRRREHDKPGIILLTLVALLHLISSIFFLLIPEWFPYNVVDFSRLYMLQQISIWIFVPLLMGIAVVPLPSSCLTRFVTLAVTYVYSLIFGTVRYIVFLYILAKASLLYMAILYFLFGPLIDFTYIVGIYSVHITRLANKQKGDCKLWKWL